MFDQTHVSSIQNVLLNMGAIVESEKKENQMFVRSSTYLERLRYLLAVDDQSRVSSSEVAL